MYRNKSKFKRTKIPLFSGLVVCAVFDWNANKAEEVVYAWNPSLSCQRADNEFGRAQIDLNISFVIDIIMFCLKFQCFGEYFQQRILPSPVSALTANLVELTFQKIEIRGQRESLFQLRDENENFFFSISYIETRREFFDT